MILYFGELPAPNVDRLYVILNREEISSWKPIDLRPQWTLKEIHQDHIVVHVKPILKTHSHVLQCKNRTACKKFMISAEDTVRIEFDKDSGDQVLMIYPLNYPSMKRSGVLNISKHIVDGTIKKDGTLFIHSFNQLQTIQNHPLNDQCICFALLKENIAVTQFNNAQTKNKCLSIKGTNVALKLQYMNKNIHYGVYHGIIGVFWIGDDNISIPMNETRRRDSLLTTSINEDSIKNRIKDFDIKYQHPYFLLIVPGNDSLDPLFKMEVIQRISYQSGLSPSTLFPISQGDWDRIFESDFLDIVFHDIYEPILKYMNALYKEDASKTMYFKLGDNHGMDNLQSIIVHPYDTFESIRDRIPLDDTTDIVYSFHLDHPFKPFEISVEENL